jgi:hypothetical protein
MAFPVSPTNGQVTVVNQVSYQYSSATNSWTRILSTANVITANTIVSNGLISATGNISGNVFNFTTIGFAFQQQNGNLYLTYNGANIISFLNNGQIIASNNITSYGTP